jgi:GT2 family glycosyltransferase
MEPAASVVIATRDRPGHLAEGVSSVLGSPGEDFELLVVDQGAPGESEAALAPHRHDPRLRYVRTDERGLSRGRNAGMALARAPLVLFTDDDCRVDPGWIGHMRRAFEEAPEAGLAFGRVRSPDTGEGGYVATFVPEERIVRDWRPAAPIHWGIGANMALRRSLVESVGWFDTQLGAGAPFPAGEEIDLTVRAIGAAVEVVHVREAEVLHVNVRRGREASWHWRGYGIGVGATLAKHARLGTPRGGASLLRVALAEAGARSVSSLVRGRRPTGLGFLGGLLLGSVRSLGHRVDPVRGVYVDE